MKNLLEIYKYVQTNNWRGPIEIILTLTLLIFAIFTLYEAISTNYWPLFILVVPLSFLFVRLFILQHDLGHGNLFKKKKYNDWVGILTGIVIFTPYYYWQKAQAIHHVSGGNRDRRPWAGDIELLTVREYRAKSRWDKFLYQLYRNNIVMFFLGSIYVFLIDHRFFRKRKGFGRREWLSIIVTNIGIVILYGPLIALGGIKFFLIAILLFG